ncbi:hypothetical protein D3C72_1500160 [compost metagenome]
MYVARRRLIEGGCDDFALDRTLHLGHFFRALVDQQHHHVHIRVVGGDGVGNALHHHRLAALGRSNDQRALAAANRGDDVDQAASDVFLGLDVALQSHLFLGEQGRQVFEHHLVLVLLGGQAVDLVELGQCKVALAILGRTHFTFNHVTRVQVEAPDLAGGDVDIVGAGSEARVEAAQKAESIGQDFQNAVGKHLFTGLGPLFDNRKHQFLFAHAAGIFNLKLVCQLEDFRHMQCLELI